MQGVMEAITGVLGERVNPDQPLMEAGLDSLGAVELRNAVAAKFGVELSATATIDYPTAATLASYLAAHMAPELGLAAVGAARGTWAYRAQRVSGEGDRAVRLSTTDVVGLSSVLASPPTGDAGALNPFMVSSC